jgi:hypothetical protein
MTIFWVGLGAKRALRDSQVLTALTLPRKQKGLIINIFNLLYGPNRGPSCCRRDRRLITV